MNGANPYPRIDETMQIPVVMGAPRADPGLLAAGAPPLAGDGGEPAAMPARPPVPAPHSLSAPAPVLQMPEFPPAMFAAPEPLAVLNRTLGSMLGNGWPRAQPYPEPEPGRHVRHAAPGERLPIHDAARYGTGPQPGLAPPGTWLRDMLARMAGSTAALCEPVFAGSCDLCGERPCRAHARMLAQAEWWTGLAGTLASAPDDSAALAVLFATGRPGGGSALDYPGAEL